MPLAPPRGWGLVTLSRAADRCSVTHCRLGAALTGRTHTEEFPTGMCLQLTARQESIPAPPREQHTAPRAGLQPPTTTPGQTRAGAEPHGAALPSHLGCDASGSRGETRGRESSTAAPATAEALGAARIPVIQPIAAPLDAVTHLQPPPAPAAGRAALGSALGTECHILPCPAQHCCSLPSPAPGQGRPQPLPQHQLRKSKRNEATPDSTKGMNELEKQRAVGWAQPRTV